MINPVLGIQTTDVTQDTFIHSPQARTWCDASHSHPVRPISYNEDVARILPCSLDLNLFVRLVRGDCNVGKFEAAPFKYSEEPGGKAFRRAVPRAVKLRTQVVLVKNKLFSK
jgi:hypothetical protein